MVILWCCDRRKVGVLTYHVSLLVDHHPQVFEDVINVCDVRLKGQKRQMFSVRDCGPLELCTKLGFYLHL